MKAHDHLDWPRLSYREQAKEGDEEAVRGNDGQTTSKSGLALNGISYSISIHSCGALPFHCLSNRRAVLRRNVY